jgi:hypothetical protein
LLCLKRDETQNRLLIQGSVTCFRDLSKELRGDVSYVIAAFLPELHHALRPEEGPQFRTSMQCRGHRGNGESFLAEVWFSSCKEGATPKLAAIIADVGEEQTVAVVSSFDQKEDLRLMPEN